MDEDKVSYPYLVGGVRSAQNIRNVGIVAHIDAGKTTVTERLLYLTGSTKTMGDVDCGNTVTDFLDMERERGITIQSAAVKFNWKSYDINLIDTPGHVDFTVEVERCARVLDGIAVILDASAGVQAQTLTVWRQASKFELPACFFVNKMDKRGANYEMSLDSIEQKLGIKCVSTTAPVIRDGKLQSIVDVVNNRYISMSSDNSLWSPISEGSLELDVLQQWKEAMCYALSDVSTAFCTQFLDEFHGSVKLVSRDMLVNTLRKAALSRKISPVSCGSALKSAHSVRTILDQVVDFLPEPSHKSRALEELLDGQFSGIVFKITHDKRKGQLSYVRIYSGSLKSGSQVFNSSRSKNEGPVRVFVPYSDELEPSSHVSAGNIAVISGLKHTTTGDTLLNSAILNEVLTKRLEDKNHPWENDMGEAVALRVDGSSTVFAGIELPEPVFFCSIEPPNTGSTHEFEKALNELSVEDPSLRVRSEVETGQTVVETMGELHMEVIKDRLVRGYGLNVFVGPLQVAYCELLVNKVEGTSFVKDTLGEKERSHSAGLTLHFEPRKAGGKFKKILVDLPAGAHPLRSEWMKAISEGCANALHNGPLLGLPVHDVSITLKNIVVSGGKVSPAILSACAAKCVKSALDSTSTQLVEPIMKLEIQISEGAVQPVLQELASRRATVNNCHGQSSEGSVAGVLVLARVPLAEMEGFSNILRTLTSGMSFMHCQLDGYEPVSEHDQINIQRRLRGNF